MVKVKINAIARTGFFSPTIRTTIETELAVRPVKGDKINFGSGNPLVTWTHDLVILTVTEVLLSPPYPQFNHEPSIEITAEAGII